MVYPARIVIETEDGSRQTWVLKAHDHADLIVHEAQVLRALTDIGFPVPHVFAGPIDLPAQDQRMTAILLSELPGMPLPWFGPIDLLTADRTCRLLATAIDALHGLTDTIRHHPVATTLPAVTLEAELHTILDGAGPWLHVPAFANALQVVRAALPSIHSPLVFSNGDYNPINFLAMDETLTGWIDFAHACFEDPYIGFAKFFLWADDSGWSTGIKAGLVERYLYQHNISQQAFIPRLVLRGLWHLQGHDPHHPPQYMLSVIQDGVARLQKERV
jgi:aminoglycoside phosphotransferase